MNMQDKELDDLFRSKLGGLEAEPSAQVWDNISAGLGNHKKRSLIPALRIAASVIVVLAAGTWFALRQTGQQPGKVTPRIATRTRVVKPVIEPAQEQQDLPATPTQAQPLNHSAQAVNTLAGNVKRVKPTNTKVLPDATDATLATPVNEPVIAQPAQVLAAVEPVKTQPVLPDVPLAVKTIDADQAPAAATQTMASAPVTASQPDKKTGKKRGIRSLGDLINVVVAKVDKREDKIIEFTETDDDQATLSGINLGIIKVKKEK